MLRLILLVSLLCAYAAGAQTYADSIKQFRKKYVDELLADKRAPVKPSQVRYISFYPADPTYRIWASFTETPGSTPFLVPTHSGKQKPFREYGQLVFSLNNSVCTLHIYQSVDLVKNAAHKDDLFIMFNDETNYESTYAGGRYIDLSVNDIASGGFMLDFNKCYNPYCAYSEGFSCPIPPDENRLHIPIMAGEKMFLH